MPADLLQLIEHFSSAITNGHSTIGPWLIAICAVALTLSGIFASLRVPSDDELQGEAWGDWPHIERAGPQAGGGLEASVVSSGHSADSFSSSRCEDQL